MVGYREKPRARNAHWANVLPCLGAQPMHLVVYKERGSYFAKHSDDENVLASVVPVNGTGDFLCKSLEEARRLGYNNGT